MPEGRKKRTKDVIIGTLVIIVLIMSAVWAVSPTKPWEPTTEKVEVRCSYQHGFYHGVQIIMDHFNLIEKHCERPIDVTYTQLSGGSATNEAILAGHIDFASMSLQPAVIGISAGVKTKVLASMGIAERELWTWRDDINSIEDLKPGMKVSVLKPDSNVEVSLIKAYLDIERTVSAAKGICVYLEYADSLTAMELKEIDATFVGAPYNAECADRGYHKITDTSTIWGKMPGSCYVATEKMYNEHPDIISAAFFAWCEACNWINENPKEASKIIGEAMLYNQDDAWELWQQSGLEFNPTYGLETSKEFSDTLYELGLIDNKLSEKQILFPVTRAMIGH